MHETSIAQALIEQVRRHTPEGHVATVARVEAGPYQAINPQALDWAWQIVTDGTELAHTKLEYRGLPFEMSCPGCGRKWTGDDPFELCTCGAEAAASGSSDLRLVSLEVEPVTAPATTEIGHK
jgi:hydrogenase nickel incorporation protein HypA/HybF